MLGQIRSAIARFRADEQASLSVEAVVVFPLLAWVYLGMFVYFDSFRSQSLTDKAGFAIADMVSREMHYITPNYLETLYQLHGMMTNDRNPTQFRLSILRWDADNNKYVMVWSERKGGAPELSNAELTTPGFRNRLPDGLPDNERLILVEGWTIYEPPFQVGLPAVRFDTFIPVRPRFTDQICWNPVEEGGPESATC